MTVNKWGDETQQDKQNDAQEWLAHSGVNAGPLLPAGSGAIFEYNVSPFGGQDFSGGFALYDEEFGEVAASVASTASSLTG